MGDFHAQMTRIQSGELVIQLAEALKPPLKALDVASLLRAVGVDQLQSERLSHSFLRSDFVGDPEDRLDMGNITLGQFVRRLNNACLLQHWEAKTETDLATFLRKHKGRSARQSPISWVEGPKVSKKVTDLQLEELLKGAEANRARITEAIERGYGEAFKELGVSLGCGVDDVTMKGYVDSTFYAALNRLVFTPFFSPKASLSKFDADLLFKPSSFDDFVKGLTDWKAHQLNLKTLQPIKRHKSVGLSRLYSDSTVDSTLNRSKPTAAALQKPYKAKHWESSSPDSFIEGYKFQSRRQSKDVEYLTKTDKWIAKCRQGLSDIFQFYAKQLRMIGKSPSFADIEQSNRVWSLGKFLKFLRDFGLTDTKNSGFASNIRVLSRAEATDLFMKHAYLRKSLSEEGFVQCLQSVALAYFNEEFDQLNRTQVSKSSDEEKQEYLYKLLECDNVTLYNKKMKGFGMPFSSDTRCRLPSDDPAKRYKFKPSRRTIGQADNRKLRDPNQESFSNPPRLRRPEPINRRLPSKKKVIEAALSSNSVITWKKLKEISFEQLKDTSDDFDLRSLIVDSDSEDLVPDKLPVLRAKTPLLHLTPAAKDTRPPKPRQVY